MPEIQKPGEVLAVRGKVDNAGRFLPRRCGSTFFVRRWPQVGQSDYVVELLDRSERPLHRVLAKVERENTCDPLEDERFHLTAYIGLHEEAAFLQIRNCDLVLWRREIPPAPTVKVRLLRQRISRDEPATLRLALSPAGQGAYIQVLYQWGERGSQTVDILEPREELKIDLRNCPGGRACRFVVIYSNGLRSAVAATRPFSLDLLGPSVTIVQPPARAVLTVGQHLMLQGQVVDRERAGGARNDDLSWWFDGNPVGRGPISGVDRLAPGRHRVLLRYESQESAEAEVAITVRPAEVPTAEEWESFDYFSGTKRR